MRKLIFISISLFFIFSTVHAIDFTQFFSQKACRVDFYFAGNNKTTSASVARIKQEPYWGGRKSNLDQTLNLGEYRFQVTDVRQVNCCILTVLALYSMSGKLPTNPES